MSEKELEKELSEKEVLLRSICEHVGNLSALDTVRGLVEQALALEIPPHEIIGSGLSQGMEVVGSRYEEQEYFVGDLIHSATLMKTGMEVLEPHLDSSDKGRGKVMFGTVSGDLHDVGKNICLAMLTAKGFTVVDLGIDVPAERIVEEVNDKEPDILGLSCLLSSTVKEIGHVIEGLEKNGLRDRVKVLIGGRPVYPEHVEEFGADAYASDAKECTAKVIDLLEGGDK